MPVLKVKNASGQWLIVGGSGSGSGSLANGTTAGIVNPISKTSNMARLSLKKKNLLKNVVKI